MSGKCLIISGGELDLTAEDCASLSEDSYVIACDRGYEHAMDLRIIPDLVIGDFDSYTGPVREDIQVIVLPHVKDDTDTHYAVKHALNKGFSDITVICALGGRLDHLYSNLQTLCHAARNGAHAAIISQDTVIHAADSSELVLKKRSGWTFSVFSATDTCQGVTISGAEYSVTDASLTNTFPIGQSNGWKDEEVRISCTEGILLVIETMIRS